MLTLFVKQVLKRKVLYSALAVAVLGTSTPSVAQKSLLREILVNLKNEIIPPSVKHSWNTLKNEEATDDEAKNAIQTLIALTGLPFLAFFLRTDIKNMFGGSKSVPLPTYVDDDNLPVHQMALDMGLDPDNIEICECDESKIGPAAATKTFYKSFILLGKKIQKERSRTRDNNDDDDEVQHTRQERQFILGHEMAHLKYNHTFKKIGSILICPWLMRAGLIVTNTLAQRFFSQLPVHKTTRLAAKATNFLCLNEIMGYIYFFFFQRTMGRMHEKQADLTSARTFKCAQAGYDSMKKFKEQSEKKSDWVLIKLMQFFDEHPSDETRMAYLKEEADKQKGLV